MEIYRDALQYGVPNGRIFRTVAFGQIRKDISNPTFADLFAGKVTVREALRNMKEPMQALVDEALAQ